MRQSHIDDSKPTPKANKPGSRGGERLTVTANYVILLIVVGFYVYPLFYLLSISLKSPAKFLAAPLRILTRIDVSNYVNAWVQGNFGQYIVNSLMYVVIPTVLTLVLTVMVAFPVSRGYIKWPNMLYTFFVIALFLPNGLIPQFILMLHLHLYNTRIGYMLLKTTGVGLGLLILTGFIKSVPKELDEAAAMDGCGYFRYVFTVIIPLVKPALATTAIFSVIGIWNDIIGPTVYLADTSKWPMVLGLFQFYGQYSNQWTVLAAGIVIVALPVVIVYIALQRYFVEGAIAGSVKS